MIIAAILTGLLVLLQIKPLREYPREWLLSVVEGRELEFSFCLWVLGLWIIAAVVAGWYFLVADSVLVLLILWTLLVYRSGY